MKTFKRIGEIISSNVNSLLEKLEDPEKMIDLSIKELEESVLEMKALYAEKTSEVKRLQDLKKSMDEATGRWENRAKLALSRNDEEMAKEALGEKIKLEKKSLLLSQSITELENILSSLLKSKSEAEEKLSDMRSKSTTLKVRARIAKEKKNVSDLTSSSEYAKFGRRIAEVSAKIDKWEASSNFEKISGENKKSFEELERENEINKELEKLKKEA